MNFIPSLQANYSPVPNTFIQLALTGKLSREAMIVLLYLFSKTYGWNQEKGFVSIEDLVHGASLSKEDAIQGIREGISHNLALELPLDPSNPHGRSMYVLNTIENRRFMDAYATASQEVPVPPEVLAATPPPPVQPKPAFETGSMDAPLDMDESPLEEASPVRTESPMPAAPKAPDLSSPAPNEPYQDWAYTFKTVEMIIRLLGRVPTKDEKARLQELGASDTELIEAMGQLIEKKVDIYSSDLIVYEFEAMQSARLRQEREVAMKTDQELRHARQKECRSCDGLGYVFIGVSGIQECEACKG